MAGDLADELGRRGIAIAVRPDAATSACDCRSRRRPCAHVLAAVYALAQLVDERPAVALELRALAPARSPDRRPVTDLDAVGFYGDRAPAAGSR